MQELAYPYLHISIDEPTGLLYSEWLREPRQEEYMEGMSHLAGCIERYPVLYWIQDSTHLSHVPLKDQREALRVMVPAVVGSQVKKIARIVALDYAYMAMFDQVVEEEQLKAAEKLLLAGREIEVQQFRFYREAADWVAGIKL